MLKRLTAMLLCVVVLFSLLPSAAAAQSNIEYWTESAYENVLQNATSNGQKAIKLVMARGEYEAAQIVLKADRDYEIQSVEFSNLMSEDGNATISGEQLQYNPIGYEYLPTKTTSISTSIRPESGYCPEWLLNARSINVKAGNAQPIWVTVQTLANQAPGTYNGTVIVATSLGEVTVNISVEVCDVVIPESKDSELNFYFWQANVGWYNKPREEDQIEKFYGNSYTRYSDNWWDLMDVFAQSAKQNRNNFLMVPTVTLLFDGGSTVDENGIYQFNWSRFDQFVEFMLERGCVKKLVGNQLVYRNNGWNSDYETYIIDRDNNGEICTSNIEFLSEKTETWFSQFLPSLQQHLASKQIADTGETWLDIWEQALADEPYSETNSNTWVALAEYMDEYAPQLFIQEALQSAGYNEKYIGKMDAWIVQLDVLDMRKQFYKQQQNNGDELWMYTCTSPRGNYLNRFVDQPVWMGRSLMWLVYQYGLDGYLHWGWNAWHYSRPKDPYGDCYSVWPDAENGTITETIRLAALRDGAEEYELLCILRDNDPTAASYICNQVVTTGTIYESNTERLSKMRELLIRAAAGEDISISVNLPYEDDFSEGMGKFVPIKGIWSEHTLEDEGGCLLQTSTSGEAIGTVKYFSGDDYTIAADFTIHEWNNGDAVGVLGRYLDERNYYHWRLGNISGTTVVQLYKKVNGVFTKLFEAPAAMDESGVNRLVLTMQGDELKGYLNQSLLVSVTDDSLAEGKAGIRSYICQYQVNNIYLLDAKEDASYLLPQEAALVPENVQWRIQKGIWEAVTESENNYLAQLADGEAFATRGNYLWEDYTASVRVRVDRLNGDASIGIVVSCGAEDSYYLWRIGQYSNGQQVLQLFLRKNGGFTKEFECALSNTVGEWHELSVDTSGGSISAYFDGILKTTVDSQLSNGYVGIRSINAQYSISEILCEK